MTPSEAGRALARLGAAKGGHARAGKLTPQRRSEIAALASQERWRSVRQAVNSAIREGRLLDTDDHSGLLEYVNRVVYLWRDCREIRADLCSALIVSLLDKTLTLPLTRTKCAFVITATWNTHRPFQEVTSYELARFTDALPAVDREG